MTSLIRLDDDTAESRSKPSRVVLKHPMFRTVVDPFFRMSEVERKPVLMIRLDDCDASLSIAGLMREFRISSQDDDGIMLGLIVRALDFVCGVRIGDDLPSEILTGKASWIADETFHDRALARLTVQLLTWMSGQTLATTREHVAHVGQIAMSAENLAHALRGLAGHIGGMTADDALAGIRLVAGELAHIDALRERLLFGGQRLSTALDRLANTFRGDSTHRELLMRLRRLAAIGVADLQRRFDEVDQIAADIVAVARDSDQLIATLRHRRDALYVRSRAWEPYLLEWRTIDAGHNARTWQLAHETYRFLAPRFMTAMEWKASPDRAVMTKRSRAGMAW